eukprot:GFUD01044458.1.p1 GENE.GFUD01044458.1~~GFUD01044458.1.p1  ORF type:complete len:358 (-),score=66.89 GFUD01044458.1:22-1095(-)
MNNFDNSDLILTLGPGTLSTVVLVVVTGCCLATLLSAYWWYKWYRTTSPQQLCCGRCHCAMALTGVPLSPQTVPPLLVASDFIPSRTAHPQHHATISNYLPVMVDNPGERSEQSATFRTLGMKLSDSKSCNEYPKHETHDISLAQESLPETVSSRVQGPGQTSRVSFKMTVSSDISPSKKMSFSKKSDSNIARPKHLFHRSCSTRKTVPPNLHLAHHGPDKHQIQQPLLDISQMCRTVLSHISPRQGDNKAGLEKTEHSVTVVRDHDQVGENYEVRELDQPVVSLPHKYIHPLNDVKRYHELVRRTSSQSQLPPTSPYNYVMDCTGYRKEGGDQNLNTPGNRQSWGSTLPQYNEFLI